MLPAAGRASGREPSPPRRHVTPGRVLYVKVMGWQVREAGKHQAAHGLSKITVFLARNLAPVIEGRPWSPGTGERPGFSASQPHRRAVASRALAHQARPKQAQL
jgi:hypothetical protein